MQPRDQNGETRDNQRRYCDKKSKTATNPKCTTTKDTITTKSQNSDHPSHKTKTLLWQKVQTAVTPKTPRNGPHLTMVTACISWQRAIENPQTPQHNDNQKSTNPTTTTTKTNDNHRKPTQHTRQPETQTTRRRTKTTNPFLFACFAEKKILSLPTGQDTATTRNTDYKKTDRDY